MAACIMRIRSWWTASRRGGSSVSAGGPRGQWTGPTRSDVRGTVGLSCYMDIACMCMRHVCAWPLREEKTNISRQRTSIRSTIAKLSLYPHTHHVMYGLCATMYVCSCDILVCFGGKRPQQRGTVHTASRATRRTSVARSRPSAA